jgi:isocitrate dehydrogenase
MQYRRIRVPEHGQAITRNEDFSLTVPDRPIISRRGDDGIGIDLTQVTHKLMNANAQGVCGEQRGIVLAAEMMMLHYLGWNEHMDD